MIAAPQATGCFVHVEIGVSRCEGAITELTVLAHVRDGASDGNGEHCGDGRHGGEIETHQTEFEETRAR